MEWKETTLGDISTDVSYGYTASATNDQVGPKFLRITDIVPDRINWDNVPYCLIEEAKTSRYLLQEGDIVVARTGATTGYNKAYVGTVPTVYASYLIRYRLDKSKANWEYVQYVLQSRNWYQFVENIKGGSAQPGANAKQFASFVFRIPPLDIQTQIAHTLSLLDAKIDLLRRQNETLEALGAAVFREWFLEGENYERIETLDDVSIIKIGRTPPRKEQEWFSRKVKDVKWVSIKDMAADGAFLLETSEYLTKDAVSQFRVPLIPANTVMLSFKMTLGRVAISIEEMVSNEAIAHFRLDDNSPITREFLYFFLKTYPYQTLGSTSSIVTSINTRMIKAMQIPVPTEDCLLKFQNFVRPTFRKIKQNQKAIKKLKATRDLLLPKLMSGQVKVRVDS